MPKTKCGAKPAVFNTARGARAAPRHLRTPRCPSAQAGCRQAVAQPCTKTPWPWGRQQRPSLSRGEAALGSVARAAASCGLAGVLLPPSSLADHCAEEPGARGTPPGERLQSSRLRDAAPQAQPWRAELGGPRGRLRGVPCAASPALPTAQPHTTSPAQQLLQQAGVDIIFS